MTTTNKYDDDGFLKHPYVQATEIAQAWLEENLVNDTWHMINGLVSCLGAATLTLEENDLLED